MENKKTNKRKIIYSLLTPIVVTSTTVGIITPTLVSCGKVDNVVFGPDVKIDGVSIKTSNIVKGKESTFEFNLPESKEIKDIKLLIGNVGIQKFELNIENNKVTIPADKMVDSKVTIVALSLQDKAKVEVTSEVAKKGVSVKNFNIIKNQDSTIELNLPEEKNVSEILVVIGDQQFYKTDLIFNSRNKFTIPGSKVKEMSILIKEITLGDAIHVESVTFSKETYTFNCYEVKTFDDLGVQVLPADADDKSFTLSCDDDNIIIDNVNHTIAAKSQIKSQITFTVTTNDGHKTNSSKIDVVNYLEFVTLSGAKECEVKVRDGATDIPTTIDVPKYAYVEGITGIFKVTKIADSGFANITSKNYIVNIGNTIREIGNFAFSCSKITSINFPDSIEKIGGGAFYNTNFYGLYVLDLSKTKITELQPCIKDDKEYGTFMNDNRIVNIAEIKLPSTIKKIGNYTFAGNILLGKVNFVNGLKEIGKYAFECTSLNKVIIPVSVDKIDDNAFNNLNTSTTINSIIFEGENENLKIGKLAFAGNPNLHEIEVHSTKIANLEQANSEGEEGWDERTGLFDNLVTFKVDPNIVINDNAYIKKAAYPVGPEIKKFSNITKHEQSGDNFDYYELQPHYRSVVEWDEEINGFVWKSTEGSKAKHNAAWDYAPIFYNNGTNFGKIKKISFADLVKEGASLIYVSIPNSVEIIDTKCFYGLSTSQTTSGDWFTPTIPENLKTINQLAFGAINQYDLKNIYLPKTLETIGEYAFAAYPGHLIFYDGTIDEWEHNVKKAKNWYSKSSQTRLRAIICNDGAINML